MQTTVIPPNSPLPGFRRDLKIYTGPQDDDGAPTYSIYDPVKGQYYKLSWSERMVLAIFRQGMTLEQLQKIINTQTPIQTNIDELRSFFLEAQTNNLLQIPTSSEYLTQLSNKFEGGWMWWLLTHYLYIRIPLFKPDKFLQATLKYAKLLVSTPMLILYGFLTITGLGIIINRWDEYIHTILHFFSFEGAIWYGLGIIFLKIVHELSHAYTAAAYGLKVPSIGVAFIVLWPVLYTDVTHGWKLMDRRQRLLISAAGILAELVLAGLATLGWALSKPGIFQSICYVLSTTSLLTTLIVNLNPALRFDGYYLLSDISGIDNLQDRSYRLGRWKMHHFFLGIEAPCPEEDFSNSKIWAVTLYSLYTWFYRITLYTTIAIFVYYAFTKSLGVILFLSEILIFLAWPFFTELAEINKVKKYFKPNARVFISLTALSILLLWFILPLPHTSSFTAFTVPNAWQIIYAPLDSEVEKVVIKINDQVKKGQLLIQLKSDQLKESLDKAKIDEKIQQIHINRAEYEPGQLNSLPKFQAMLDQLKEKKLQLQNQMDALQIVAEIDGVVFNWDRDLFVGENLSKGKELGRIANLKQINVYAFVPEEKMHTVMIGNKAEFYIPSSNLTFNGKIINAQPFRAQDFSYIPSASKFGGNIPVIEKNNKLEVIESYYIVEIQLEGDHYPQLGQTGDARWKGPNSSYAMDLMRFIHRTLLKESGF